MAPKPWTKADYELRKEPSAGNHGTADVLPRLVGSYKHSMLSQGDLQDLGISYDRFQTLWSIFPDSFIVWKSLTLQGRPTIFIAVHSE